MPTPLVTALPSELDMALPVDELVPFAVDVECDELSEWLADTTKLTLPLEDSFLPSATVSVMLSVDVDESVTLSLLDSETDSFVESVSL